jgi:uncharacterized protein YoxC
MTVNEVFLGIITAAVVVIVVFAVRLVIKLTETAAEVREFLETTDLTVKGVAGEVTESLRSFRVITDGVGGVASDVRAVTESFKDAGLAVQEVASSVKDIGKAVQDLGAETVASVCGLRAGFKAGLDVFVENLLGPK